MLFIPDPQVSNALTRSAGFRYDSFGSTRAQKKKMHTGAAAMHRKKLEVGKPGVESMQKFSDHAVDWFLVSPGLTLRGLDLRSQTGGFFFLPFQFARIKQFLDHLLSRQQKRRDH